MVNFSGAESRESQVHQVHSTLDSSLCGSSVATLWFEQGTGGYPTGLKCLEATHSSLCFPTVP